MRESHFHNDDTFLDELEQTLEDWHYPEIDVQPPIDFLNEYTTEETFLNALRTNVTAPSFARSAHSRWQETINRYFILNKKNGGGKKYTQEKYAKICGVDIKILRKWRYGEAIASREQMIRFGIGMEMPKATLNSMLSYYGYRELYPLDPEDLITLIVMNDKEKTQKLTKESSMLHAIEKVRNQVSKRFYPNLMWGIHFSEIHKTHKCIDKNAIKPTKLNNWLQGKSKPDKKDLDTIIRIYKLDPNDAAFLSALYRGSRSSRWAHSRLNDSGNTQQADGTDLTKSFLYPVTKKFFPELFASSDSDIEEAEIIQTLFADDIVSKGNVENSINFMNRKLNTESAHNKVAIILDCYFDIWHNSRRPDSSQTSRAAFCNQYGEYFPYAIKRETKKETAEIDPLTSYDIMQNRLSNLQSDGRLLSRYEIILTAITLDMNLSETNLLLKSCHYPPLNDRNDRLEYLISYSMAYAYHYSAQTFAEERQKEMKKKLDKLTALDPEWELIYEEHAKKTCTEQRVPNISSFIAKVCAHCLNPEPEVSQPVTDHDLFLLNLTEFGSYRSGGDD